MTWRLFTSVFPSKWKRPSASFEILSFNPDPAHYHRNRTGKDSPDAHMKRQIIGWEVVVAITKAKLDFGQWEQIVYGGFDGHSVSGCW